MPKFKHEHWVTKDCLKNKKYIYIYLVWQNLLESEAGKLKLWLDSVETCSCCGSSHRKTNKTQGREDGKTQLPGMCIVVMVVVVIRVVVVSSSMGSGDMVFLDPVWLAAEEELKAVVSSPGDMAVAVDSVCPIPGAAWVGLVVVPAESKSLIECVSFPMYNYYSCIN